jgi:hypothetical protein
VEHGGPNEPLTRGRVVVRWSGDGDRWRRPKAHSGEGVVDLDEMREGWEQLQWSEARPSALL